MAKRTSPLVVFGLALAALVGTATWWILRDQVSSESAPIVDEPVKPAADKKPSETTAVEQVASPSLVEERQGLPGDPIPPPPPPPLELELHTFEDAPIAGAIVCVFTSNATDGDVIVGKEKSDEHGVAHFKAASGAARALVLPPNATPWLGTTTLEPGRKKLVEPERKTARGTIRVDSAGLTAALEFTLSSDRALVPVASIPEAVRSLCDLSDDRATHLKVKTDEHGVFEIRGIADPYSGSIELAKNLWIAKCSVVGARIDRNTVRLDHVFTDVAIDAIALPELTGRIVETAGGAGVPHAIVDAWVAFAGGEPSRNNDRFRAGGVSTGHTDDDGRFKIAIGIPRGVDLAKLANATSIPAIQVVTLNVNRSDRSDGTKVSLKDSSMAGAWDVGEVVLGAPRRLEIVVKDSSGAPIEGAVAMGRSTSPRTDSNGHTSFANVSEDVKSLSVGKFGWHEVDVEIPEKIEAPLEAVLEPTNKLELAFVDANGARLPKQRASLVSTRPAFRTADPIRPSETHGETGGTDPERSRRYDDGTCIVQFRADEDGVARFSDLDPEVPIVVRSIDGLGAIVDEHPLSIGALEDRHEEVRVNAQGSAFRGRVVDDHGEPLAFVRLTISSKAIRFGDSRNTDAAGAFEFVDLKPGHVRLDLQRQGFSPWAIDDYELPLGGDPVELRMYPSIQLTLEVVDAVGRPVPTQELKVRAPTHPNLPVRRESSNSFVLYDLPGERVRVTAKVAGVAYDEELDPGAGDSKFVVPEHGKVLITLTLSSSAEVDGEYHARIAPSNAPNKPFLYPLLDLTQRPPRAFVDAILPGTYRVDLQFWKIENKKRTSVVSLPGTTMITVVGGATEHVDFTH